MRTGFMRTWETAVRRVLVTDLDPMLGAEDFGFFAQEAPSCMIFVGTGGDVPMHNPVSRWTSVTSSSAPEPWLLWRQNI